MIVDPFDSFNRKQESAAGKLIDSLHEDASEYGLAEEIYYLMHCNEDNHYNVALVLAKAMIRLKARIEHESQARDVVRNAFIGALGVTHRRLLWRPCQIERLLLDVEHDIQTILSN